MAERDRMLAELASISYLKPYPSEANFMLIEVQGRDAFELKRSLEDRGVLVRYYRTPRLKNCIRLSVGTPEQGDTVLAALREV